MPRDERTGAGLARLRHAVLSVWCEDLLTPAVPSYAGVASSPGSVPRAADLRVRSLLSEAVETPRTGRVTAPAPPRGPGNGSGTGSPSGDDHDDATSSVEDPDEAARLIGLVEQARAGDHEAFGQLFDHYHRSVYRFVYYRTGSVQLAEDLTSETFFRALRNIGSFRWQGKDFGAWLVTIARNLTTDHFKSARNRLEHSVEDTSLLDSTSDGPESAVLSQLTNEALLEALHQLPTEQEECIVLRFLQGQSIAEVATALGRSEGAVKQLQLRGVRNLAKLMPEGLR